jgi:hypothetical protein
MFVWQEPTPDPKQAEARKAKHAAMYRRELEDHAALLLRLGHRPAFVKSRLAANVAWDFQLHAAPTHAQEVDKIVDAVARRLTPAR